MSDASITALLEASRQGDLAASEQLMRAVYGELQKIAHAHRVRWRGNDTINTTALIHESFIKIASGQERAFASRTHFYATASRAMRQILLNYAEQQSAAKRGGDGVRVPLEEAELIIEASVEEMLSLEQALRRLEAEHPRHCRIVECRVFGGMTVEETAEALGISAATVKREWQIASAALYRQLHAT